jgi:uncharacterized membrane protein (DUF485 family)
MQWIGRRLISHDQTTIPHFGELDRAEKIFSLPFSLALFFVHLVVPVPLLSFVIT